MPLSKNYAFTPLLLHRAGENPAAGRRISLIDLLKWRAPSHGDDDGAPRAFAGFTRRMSCSRDTRIDSENKNKALYIISDDIIRVRFRIEAA